MADVFEELEEAQDSIGEEIGQALASAIVEINNSNDKLVRQMVDILAASDESEKMAVLFNKAVSDMSESNKLLIAAVSKIAENRTNTNFVFDVVRDQSGFIQNVVVKNR
jgi:soluble lytic murein transglycosylase-like protein